MSAPHTPRVRPATHAENLRTIVARLSERLSVAEVNELYAAAAELEHQHYADIEHEHLGCDVAKTGIYARESNIEHRVERELARIAPSAGVAPWKCPDTKEPCAEFCDRDKGDQCARTNEQISSMTEAQKAAYWFDLYLEETTKRRALERQQSASVDRDAVIEECAAYLEKAPLTYAGPDPQGVKNLRFLIVLALRGLKGTADSSAKGGA